ncbi:MAG: hypothetical protein IPJ11_16970 [Gemmatimonadetes bacterium]|nr:hypothetical protein [Gemmatimonadota bacterium]
MLTPAAALAALTLLTAPPADGVDVLRAVHARYAGKWFTSMTFVQKTTFGTGKVQTWYEAMEVPGKLRIDMAPASAGQGMLFRNDTLYRFAAGKQAGARAMKHPMLILLHDVHAVPLDSTVAKLRSLGFDLAKTHETTWDGKAVIVVGALAGDTTSSQFWLEKERLLLVRLIDPSMDARFSGYNKHGSAWVEGRIEIWQKGKLTQLEEYTDVKTGVQHEPGLFDPARTTTPTWVGAGQERWPVPPAPGI